MSMADDDLIGRLQEDILATLLAVPSLDGAEIMSARTGDAESKLLEKLARAGLAVVVMNPRVDDAEPNLPGPPMRIRCEVQVIEHVLNNASLGGATASTVAIRVLGALHHRVLGAHALYTAKEPVKPVPVQEGLSSYMAEVHVRIDGITRPEMPAAVQAAWEDDALVLTCATEGAAIWWTADGTLPRPGAEGSALYEAPLELGPGTKVRAAAYVPDMNPGDVAELTVIAD